ncbi:acetylglutamate kinase [Pasteurellaceae bacterium HPA106]|uniref:acetylglutamate kinase n=1 Tax=Spirabiliibacterium pneumoniae TaxID=221400 RepID=UPI001AACEED2|nr:acetylglutamate kinase [Spirabiliibacterium pneumoniae]MBE2896077.1 acetylglutamate kinase [Spirabiliibacterium pneumoniae]
MQTVVLKVGGALLDNPQAMDNLLTALYAFRQHARHKVVIVHGGGVVVDNLMASLHLPVRKKQGLRITPSDQINAVTGALAGTTNKTLLAQALHKNLNAVGLCLGDGNMTRAHQFDVDLGHVAHVAPGDATLLRTLLNAGFLPLISSIGIDSRGRLMNVNADDAAVCIATLLSARLVLLSDVEGVLDSQGQRLPQLNRGEIDQLIQRGVITGGMAVKVNAAWQAAKNLGGAVNIASWKNSDQLTALLRGELVGTTIQAN